MMRRLFTAASALSFAAFLLIVAGWAYGHTGPTETAFARGGCFWDVTIDSEYVSLTRIANWSVDEPIVRGHGHTIEVHTHLMGMSRYSAPLGLFFVLTGQGSVEDMANRSIDPWGNPTNQFAPFFIANVKLKVLAAMFAVLPAVWVFMWRRRRSKTALRGFDVQPAEK